MKRIIIIHYHLNPGGVTRIIESQIKSLKECYPNLDILVLTGHCEKPDVIRELGADILTNENLNYLPETGVNINAEFHLIHDFLSTQIRADDIVHVHNLNLGKNPLLTLVISNFIEEGYLVLNHAHDFAEDRPKNWNFLKNIIEDDFGKNLQQVLYPNLPNLLHATLNSFDKRRLTAYGVRDENAFLLPNPVSLNQKIKTVNSEELKRKICNQLSIDPEKKLVSYPVRVIRRKNIGEYILLATLFSEEANWLVTQPPKNPLEIEPYEEWKKFCSEMGIRLIFEAGIITDFEELLFASDFCVTTSIKEGFGMVYLEPWLFNTPVIGRDLSQITEDIKKSGLKFPLLYSELKVPANGDFVDFPSLSESDQMECIENVLINQSSRNLVISENQFLENLLNFKDDKLVEHNKSIIKQEFSLHNYAKQLEKIYQRFAE